MTTMTYRSERRRAVAFLVALAVMAVAALLPSRTAAQNPNLGTSGAQFLQIPVGARPTAMGGASVGNVRDASAMFWNPAGIAGVRSNDVHFSYTSWWADIRLSHVAYVFSAEDIGSFGVAASVLSMDDMEVTTELQPEGTGQQFDAQDLMLGAAYARRLTEDFIVGVTVKYINQRIWNTTASGIAFDVGTQYAVGIGDLTLAMSMTNFGADIRYDGEDLNVRYDADPDLAFNRTTPSRLYAEEYPLPLHFQVGVSMTVLRTEDVAALVALDVTHPNDNDERVNVGTEVQMFGQLFLRGGYRFGYDTERATLGLGFAAPLGSTRLSFDYAYAIYDPLPNVSRLSLGVSF